MGDIHGRLDALEALLGRIHPTENDTLIFLGDCIDRGPDSVGVVDLLMKLDRDRDERDIFLMGNHEEMLLRWLGVLETDGYPDAWLGIGGYSVLRDWGGSVPDDVLAWLTRRLLVRYRTDLAYYVHGGFREGPDFYEATTDDECRWLRTEFARSTYRYPKPVIVGHTTVDMVPRGRFGGGPVLDYDRNVMFIDTAAYITGILCAYDVTNREAIVVRVGAFR